jgi:tripartite-type tricarboxylate transporter receptor subunit TctC
LLVLTDERLKEYPEVQSFKEVTQRSFPIAIWWAFFSNHSNDIDSEKKIQQALKILITDVDFQKELQKDFITSDDRDMNEYFNSQLTYMKSLDLK